MGNSVLNIAMSKEHLCSPFSFEIGRNLPHELSTDEKIVSIVCAVLLIPTIIGAPIAFYLVTAYFKSRALSAPTSDGLNITIHCKAHGDFTVCLGFGNFEVQKVQSQKCPTCNKSYARNNFTLTNCAYSYKGVASCDNGEVEDIEGENPHSTSDVIPENTISNWVCCNLTVSPLKA